MIASRCNSRDVTASSTSAQASTDTPASAYKAAAGGLPPKTSAASAYWPTIGIGASQCRFDKGYMVETTPGNIGALKFLKKTVQAAVGALQPVSSWMQQAGRRTFAGYSPTTAGRTACAERFARVAYSLDARR
jgi:hypothetical protein